MAHSILKELPELIKANILSEEVAGRIQDYYQSKAAKPNNRLTLVFGLLGSLLIGLGIILVISHNWDKLSQTLKAVLAFLPLLLGQGLCLLVLIKPKISDTWRESAAGFTFLAIGACIALISQTYHISGELDAFLLTWALLGLPLIYVLRSSFASLLNFLLITYYVAVANFMNFGQPTAYWYWLLFCLGLPHYYRLFKSIWGSNFFVLHNWLLPISLSIGVATLAQELFIFLFPAFVSLFGIFYLIGTSPAFKTFKNRNNGFKVIGGFGEIYTLYHWSSNSFRTSLTEFKYSLNQLLQSPEFLAACFLFLIALAIWIYRYRHQSLQKSDPLEIIFFFFIPVFIFGFFSTALSTVGINLMILGLGIYHVVNGIKLNNLSQVNGGLLIISILIICRFFDSDLSFIIRGILFILVGFLFFFCNFWILQKRKNYAQ